MTIETTNGQQPNPGTGDSANPDAANPTGQPSTASNDPQGQGNEGEKTADQLAAEQAEADRLAAEEAANNPNGAPEAYSDFTIPEGFTLEGARKNEALAIFKELNLSQPGAQRAIEAFTKLVSEDTGAIKAAMDAERTQQIEQWGIDAKTQLGDKYDETVALATTAVKAVNDPALTAAFNEQGWGNHPALIKAFAVFGSVMRDSPMDGTGSPAGAGKDTPASPIDRMYAHDPAMQPRNK
jgi:hypothetical protein